MYSSNTNDYPINEETLIHSLVDDIYKAESKINEITQNQNEYNDNNPQLKQIKELEEKKGKLQKNLTEISSSLLSYLSNNDTQIKIKQVTINDLNNQINQLKDKLSTFNPISFQSLTLSKYILSNNTNNFLTKEQINEIILDSKQTNNYGNEIFKYKKDIENYETNKNNILNSIEELKQKEDQIKELLRMSKEEKLIVKDEIINLISQKESLDEILKFKKLNMSLMNDYINNNQNNNNKIELNNYEIENLDINKASNKLVEDLTEIIEINNNRENNKFVNSNGNNNNLESLNNNNIQISVNENYLSNIIKSELGNYIKMLKIKQDNYINHNIKQFLYSLTKKIIECFNTNSYTTNIEEFSYNNINDYLLYFFKAIHYDGIIENKLNFINKEYKYMKKERNKILENLFLNITKLKSKLEDIDYRITDISSQIKSYAEENQINENLLKPNLTKNELAYIEISNKGNNLLNKKNDILNEILKLENESKKVKKESDEKTNETKKNLEQIDEEINKLKNEIEVEKLKSNQEIITLRKLIADKFNIIKTQLQIYKSKYGSNLTIYNKLVDSINSTIKSTYYKPLFGFERTNNNNSYIESKSMIQDHNNLYSPRLKNFTQVNQQPNSFISENLYTLKGNNEMNESNLNLNLNNNNNNNINNYSINEYQKIPTTNYSYTNINNSNFRIKSKAPLSRSSHNIFINNTNNESIFDKSLNESKYSINRINLSIDKTISNYPTSNRNKPRQKKEININIPQLIYPDTNTNYNLNQTNPLTTKDHDLNISRNSNYISYNPNQYLGRANSIHSIYNIRTNYNLNNNDNNKIWLEEKEKLGQVIQNLKDKIYKTEKMTNFNNSLMNKLNPLTQITFCYYRAINGPYHKFNPLSNINPNNLIVHPYNFIKSTISLSKKLDTIKIVPSTQLDILDLKIENIQNTIVNSIIKVIIEIHRNYRRYKVNNKNGNLDNFIEKEYIKYDKLSKKDISKCALNKTFNFSLLMKNNYRIEILLCSYEDFKMWVNGFAFIIKNKNEILKNIQYKDELEK